MEQTYTVIINYNRLIVSAKSNLYIQYTYDISIDSIVRHRVLQKYPVFVRKT